MMDDSDANVTDRSPEQVENLRKAIQFFKELEMPGGMSFNIGEWGVHPINSHLPPEDNYCGTACCAMGLLGLFGPLDLEVEWVKDVDVFELKPTNGYWGQQVQRLFGFDYRRSPFSPMTYTDLGRDPTIDDVITRLEKYLP